MKKSIVCVITYNRLDLLKDCLATLEPFPMVAVFDDGSIDGTVEWLEQWANNAVLRRWTFPSDCRLGVARNSNRAIKFAMEKRADTLFLLNDDLLVKDTKIFDLYANAIEKTGFGYYCYTDKRSPFKQSESFVVNDIELERHTSGDGAFIVMSRRAMETLGGFDPAYGLCAGEHFDAARRASAAGLSRDTLDVAATKDMVRIRQYSEIVPRAISDRAIADEAMQHGFATWMEQSAQPAVIWKPLEV